MEKEAEEFWLSDLKGARYILAPMVEQSELPWRLLSRHYGAQLCYTPMLHASVFVKDARYRKESLISCKEDRPLIVQFCANDPQTFADAACLAQDHCEAIDLNLGCPQAIARRGNYGAFLENNWDLLREMVSLASRTAKIPITCKIRIFQDIQRTVEYAKMLESSGCKLLCVHGRTKEQKGSLTSLASWEHIKAIKKNVKIPVFANGNIQYLHDVENCFRETGVDGVMIAEGSLHNPALFCGINPPMWQMAFEYLNLVKSYPCPMSCVRGHLFKLCHHFLSMEENKDLRQTFAWGKSIEDFWKAVEELKLRVDEGRLAHWKIITKDLLYPPWVCQPYVRPPHKTQDDILQLQQQKRCSSDSEEIQISKKKLKKLLKNKLKSSEEKKVFEKCVVCLNPRGIKCVFNMCKLCCKSKTSKEILNCSGHKFLYLMREKSLLQKSQNIEISIVK